MRPSEAVSIETSLSDQPQVAAKGELSLLQFSIRDGDSQGELKSWNEVKYLSCFVLLLIHSLVSSIQDLSHLLSEYNASFYLVAVNSKAWSVREIFYSFLEAQLARGP